VYSWTSSPDTRCGPLVLSSVMGPLCRRMTLMATRSRGRVPGSALPPCCSHTTTSPSAVAAAGSDLLSIPAAGCVMLMLTCDPIG
jgi:hypothetical protein